MSFTTMGHQMGDQARHPKKSGPPNQAVSLILALWKSFRQTSFGARIKLRIYLSIKILLQTSQPSRPDNVFEINMLPLNFEFRTLLLLLRVLGFYWSSHLFLSNNNSSNDENKGCTLIIYYSKGKIMKRYAGESMEGQ